MDRVSKRKSSSIHEYFLLFTWKKAFSYDPMSSVASMRKLRAWGRGWGNSGTGRGGGEG